MHRIRLIALVPVAVALCIITAFSADQLQKSTVKPAEPAWGGRVVELPKQKLKTGAGTIVLDIDVPRGYHFAPEAPTTLKWKTADDGILHLPNGINERKGIDHFPVEAKVTGRPGLTVLVIDAAVFYCENGSKLCQMDNVRITAPIEVSTTGPEKITLLVEAGQDFGAEE